MGTENEISNTDRVAFFCAMVQHVFGDKVVKQWKQLEKELIEARYIVKLYNDACNWIGRSRVGCYDLDGKKCPFCCSSKCESIGLFSRSKNCLIEYEDKLKRDKAQAEQNLADLEKQYMVLMEKNCAKLSLLCGKNKIRDIKMKFFCEIKSRWTENYRLLREADKRVYDAMVNKFDNSNTDAKNEFNITCLDMEIIYYGADKIICPECKNKDKCKNFAKLQKFAQERSNTYETAYKLRHKRFINLILFRKSHNKNK